MTPNDSYYNLQWHFASIGDIKRVWDDYNGAGVHVGVYDAGIDFTNPDLAGQEDPSRRVVIDGVALDGNPYGSSTYHGTSVAGLIAASGNNGVGVVGVAWGASLTSVNIFDTRSPIYANATDLTGFMSSLHQMTNFDVTNNSWGASPEYSDDTNVNSDGSERQRQTVEYAYVSANGRAGLGTVIVQSAGNDSVESNGDNLASSRYTITVAAARQDGFASSYSNYGVDVLVTAPGSEIPGTIVTTDRTGDAGFYVSGGPSFDGSGNYNGKFNGTSASAPIVTGVVTLMLEANPDLGWRDVQNLLAQSATRTGSAIGAASAGLNENGLWLINGADGWNGGGAHFSVDYGYGMVNAYNAVRMAEAQAYHSPVAQTSANERSLSTGTLDATRTIAANATTFYSFTVSGDLDIEHVDLTLGLTVNEIKKLTITLISPDGTPMRVHDGSLGLPEGASPNLLWTYGIDGLRGELTAGTWTVSIENRGTNAQTLNSVKLEAFGSTPSTDDVTHYTDEFSDMVALAGARAILADTDGGTDWIDASAVHAASTIDLTTGAATIDGTALTVSGVENIVSGDGDDRLTAAVTGSHLAGMRGADTLTGGIGDDVLEGGVGGDALVGGGGSDTASYEHAGG